MQTFGFIIMWLLILIVFVRAQKNRLLINDSSDIWLKEETFAHIIEVSLDLSACINVYLSGNSVGVENIFNSFVRVYPYEYTLNDRTYSCNGHFMISTSVEKLVNALKSVPTKISTTELLIFIDDKVEEPTRLFNVSMYENANVNIAAPNGLWTLSENYLHPRKFKKTSRYEKMIHKQGIVDLQGRELQAATFFNRPLCYLNSTINRTVDGIEAEFYVAKEPELDGVEIKLFLLMAKRLNFTWSIRRPSDNYRYGIKTETGWHGGVIGQMYRNEVDIAFGAIWLEIEPYEITNLSIPWMQVDLHFLVPRPKPYTTFWALTKPLSRKVWAATIIMLIVKSIYVYSAAWINPRISKRFRNFTITWTEMMSRILGMGDYKRMEGLKWQFQLWHMIGVLVVTAYSSSLEASLANPGYHDRIDTTKQFIEANLSWGREGRAPHFSSFMSEWDPWVRQFPLHFQSEANEEERHEKIINGNYAILGRIVDKIFFPENFIRDEDLKDYRVMRDSVGKFYVSFAVPPWLMNSIDKVMLRLIEGGLVNYHLEDVLRRRTSSALHDVLIEHDDDIQETARSLELTPLGAGFSMLAFGLIISAIVFFFELRSCISDEQKSIIDVLRKISRMRKIKISEKRRFLRAKNLHFFIE